MQICIYEDAKVSSLEPLTLTRPAFMLRCGAKLLVEKIRRGLGSEHNYVYLVRPEFDGWLQQEGLSNRLLIEDTLFISARAIYSDQIRSLLGNIESSVAFVGNDDVVAFTLLARDMNKMTDIGLDGLLADLPKRDIEVASVTYFWDLVNLNRQQLLADSVGYDLGQHGCDTTLATLITPGSIFLGQGCKLEAGVIIDASDGPVIIEEGTLVMANSVIRGPAYIGQNCCLKVGSKIYQNTTIGPVCKVGGEVEGSILLGYSNKQHEGFLGHAYLGEWVNLGAGTENSDLKNNYKDVGVNIGGVLVNSGSRFLGCCIGDHTKTGIQTMITTGSVFGVFCNIFGGGFQPKYLPSFCWHDNDRHSTCEYVLDKALETAEVVVSRRGVSLTDFQRDIYHKVFGRSTKQRDACIFCTTN